MADLNEQKHTLYAKYDAMSTKELETLLQDGTSQPSGEEMDIEEELYISKLIADRETAAPTGRYGDPARSWADFQRRYLSPEEKPAPSRKKRRKLLRTIPLAATLVVFLVISAYATGFWEWIAGWNDDDFYYTQSEEQAEAELVIAQPDEPFETLEEALAFYDAPENIVPAYIPEGYEYGGFEYSIMEPFADFCIYYVNDTSTIIFSYILYSSEPSGQYSKDAGDPEIYTVNGIDHYIMTNVGRYKAVWQNGCFECSISGFESINDLIRAIDSMYTEATD